MLAHLHSKLREKCRKTLKKQFFFFGLLYHNSHCQQIITELKIIQAPSRHSSEENGGLDLVESTVQLMSLRQNHGQNFAISQIPCKCFILSQIHHPRPLTPPTEHVAKTSPRSNHLPKYVCPSSQSLGPYLFTNLMYVYVIYL